MYPHGEIHTQKKKKEKDSWYYVDGVCFFFFFSYALLPVVVLSVPIDQLLSSGSSPLALLLALPSILDQ